MPASQDIAAPAAQTAPISVMIFTFNEEIHLPKCLDWLAWCDDVIVIDSYSTDRTVEICRAKGVGMFQHAFEGFGSQRNWAIENVPMKYDWVLILDADELVPDTLVGEIRDKLARVPGNIGAFQLRRRFHMWGRWLRYSALYPTWVVRLVHKTRVKYVNRGHAETQQVDGDIGRLHNDLIDENLKGIDEWFERQNRYSRAEAEYELREEQGGWLSSAIFSSESIKRRAALKQLAWRLPGRGFAYFIYSYVVRLGFLDGRDGFMFCVMRSVYQAMIEVKKHDARRLRGGAPRAVQAGVGEPHSNGIGGNRDE